MGESEFSGNSIPQSTDVHTIEDHNWTISCRSTPISHVVINQILRTNGYFIFHICTLKMVLLKYQ